MKIRSRSTVRLLAIALISLLDPRPFSAAQAQVAQPPAYASRNSLVRVDVVVSDAKGAPIADLRKEDFQIVEAGAVQPIETLEYRSGGRVRTAAAAPARSALDRPDVEPPAGRLLALFLDEYHVSAGDHTQRVRDALTRFVDEQLRPEDLVAVMKPLDSVVAIRLTRSRDEIRTAIDRFAGCKGDYAPRTPLEANVISRAPGAAEAARAQVVMSALHALASYIGGQRDGRKAIVFVSEGFPADAARSRIRLPDVASIVRAANRFDVAIYAFDPRVNGPAPAAPAAPAPPDQERAFLQSVADQTGGEAIAAADAFVPALQRVARDLDAYYTLRFKPSAANDGAFHPIQVRVSRKGALVRARSGYWATTLDELRRARITASSTPAFKPKPQHLSPIVQPWFRMTRGDNGRTRILFWWEAKTAASTSAPRTAPPSAVMLSATGLDGKTVFQGRVAPVRNALDATLPTHAIVEAPPGQLAIEMAVEDINERVVDSDARVIAVPDLNGARTILGTPEVVRTRTAVEFRTAAGAPDTPPTAARVFTRGEHLLIRVPAYGPGGSAATVTARLMNALAQPMRDLAPIGPPSEDGLTQFDLLLAPLAPAEYRIEFTARGADGVTRDVLMFRLIG